MASRMVFRIGSFNFGIHQNMLGGRGQHQMNMPRELTTKRNVAKFQVLCYDMVNEVNAHILFGCEVGGKQEGFGAVGVEVYDILSQPFGEDVLV